MKIHISICIKSIFEYIITTMSLSNSDLKMAYVIKHLTGWVYCLTLFLTRVLPDIQQEKKPGAATLSPPFAP